MYGQQKSLGRRFLTWLGMGYELEPWELVTGICYVTTAMCALYFVLMLLSRIALFMGV